MTDELVPAPAEALSLLSNQAREFISASKADDVQHTGQSQQTRGVDSSVPANPAQGDKPAYPCDQPPKEGMDPSSQVHDVDPRDLEGKTHKER